METGQGTIEQARELVGEITRLARAHENKTLLAIDAKPETEQLLAALPQRESRQAQVHLKSARIWQAKLNRRAQGKLDAAAKALNELDLVLARGILRKIDAQILDQPTLARYDEMLLALEARAMELDEIEAALPDPAAEKDQRRRFWKR